MIQPKPTISVIIPTYNSGATLSIALASIKRQVFKDLEVLIIDGVSTDNTLEIAQKYKSHFQVLTVVSEPDKGIYDAMNKGISLAKGEWLFFMGSDDSLFSAHVLEKIFSLRAAQTHDVIYGNVQSTRFAHPYDGEFSYYKLATKNICHQSIFFRRSVFQKIGKFNLKYKIWADWDHNIRWFYSSRIKKYYTDATIAYYADGGLSSLNEDVLFIKRKNLKLLIHGFTKLPPAARRDICNLAIEESQKKKSVVLPGFLKVVRFILRIHKFISHKFISHKFKK
ncbi:Glycosyltransferase involved in cell wall bisynthesis [Salinimicrobium sediminis]|uniref:Glycosyltransferase involved in cell wall bisynthesis n=1 Tax=Salinimicrobium sediminis TaxID=1343891 RepID=A0A285WZM8_9FLAO|nr:glycosyltransferase family 2 protein [Salinimicrobium sediminis]SOC78571.1 Glycosyltransferase involved in cell wall bisynthesis [Salinimicrobium sediminis]